MFYSKFMNSAIPSSEQPLAQRLRRLAAWVRGLALCGGLLIAALPLWLLAGTSTEPIQNLYGGHLLSLLHGELTWAVRARLAAVTLLPVGWALGALWQLWALFGAYRQGDVFGSRPVGHLRHFGWAMVGLAVAEPLSTALASVAISLDNPPGQRMLAIGLGSHDYALLMCALVFVAVARVMAEAARLAEENAQLV
jgi:hypothetical protein